MQISFVIFKHNSLLLMERYIIYNKNEDGLYLALSLNKLDSET